MQDDLSQIEKIDFNEVIKVGKVTAIASYGVLKAMEIADDFIDNSYDENADLCREKIDKLMLG